MHLIATATEGSWLVELGRPDLAERVEHTSAIAEQEAGYNIASFFDDGRTKFIKVITTCGPRSSNIWLSQYEVELSKAVAEQYELCCVSDYDVVTGRGSCNSLFGPLDRHFELIEMHFRASLKRLP